MLVLSNSNEANIIDTERQIIIGVRPSMKCKSVSRVGADPRVCPLGRATTGGRPYNEFETEPPPNAQQIALAARIRQGNVVVCTLALYFRCFDHYPLLLAANRDEHYDRPSAPPALWDGGPRILAGKDLRAGGTWLGVNEFGLLVGILNRRINGTPLPANVARSRGLLCAELLHTTSVEQAVSVIAQDRATYNPFTVVFADAAAAHVAYNSDEKIQVEPLNAGVHVFSSAAEVDLHSAKAERARAGFSALMESLSPRLGQPSSTLPALQKLLSDHSLGDGSDNPGDAICVHREAAGTVSSSAIFLNQAERQFTSFHCAGAPCQNTFGAALHLALR
jgi:uncharacterized protein with NRDE domain